MRNYNSLDFTIEDNEGELLIVAKQTFVNRITDKPDPLFPPEYAIVAVNRNKEAMMIIRASKKVLQQLGMNLINLDEFDKKE